VYLKTFHKQVSDADNYLIKGLGKRLIIKVIVIKVADRKTFSLSESSLIFFEY
jgi:hypothetical protein